MEIHHLSRLLPEDTKRRYLEFLHTKNMSAGVYRLPAGAEDTQQPHNQEEIYYVISGRARFTAGQKNVAILPGDTIFVPAGEIHRFRDIEEDLELLVLFAPPEGPE